ncbi:hypothetical protein, partial [Escherichia coli]|uniref:hypothetical protein n=1 Tax=Escherichia coli TaxID=562 RepID=UPI00159537EA
RGQSFIFLPLQKQKPAEAGFYVHQVKLTDKPLSFGYSVVDSHSSFCPFQKQKPAEAGFYVHQVKLTDKPLSFGYSVVDSHSSFCPFQK